VAETAVRWSTESVQFLPELKALIREAYRSEEDALTPEERIRLLLESERSRRPGSRVMLVHELDEELEDLGRSAPDSSATDHFAGNTSKAAGVLVGERQVRLQLIDPSPYQARTRFDGAALEELAESIRENGLLQSIVLRKHPGDPGRFQLVSGERRLRAMRSLGWEEGPAVVREYSDEQLIVLGIVENLQRADLSVVEEARGFGRYLDEIPGATQTKLAEEIGKTQSYVSNRLRLLKLPAAILDLVDDGSLSPTHARDHLIPLTQLREDLRGPALEAVTGELGKRDGGFQDEADLCGALVGALGHLSRPLDWYSLIWSVDKETTGGRLPEEFRTVHAAECSCNAPGVPISRSANGKKVRCFDLEWWKETLARLKAEAEAAKGTASPAEVVDEGEDEQASPPPLEWPNRSVVVPGHTWRSAVDEWSSTALMRAGSGIAGLETGDALLDPGVLSPEHLYWIEGAEGDPPVLVTTEVTEEAEGSALDEFDALFADRVRERVESDLAAATAAGPVVGAETASLIGIAAGISSKRLQEIIQEHGWLDREPDWEATATWWPAWLDAHWEEGVTLARILLIRAERGDLHRDPLHDQVTEQLRRQYAQYLYSMCPAPETPTQEA
jgi:ParB/RepB/Spo0J family partition protein